MKKALALFLALVLCLSLAACSGSKKPKEVELTTSNFEKYLSVSIEVEDFDKGQLAPDGTLYQPKFNLKVTVTAANSGDTFADTVLKLTLTDKANPANLGLGPSPIEIVIDENGNGTFTKEGISWLASSVTEPKYEILTAVSEVAGIVTTK